MGDKKLKVGARVLVPGVISSNEGYKPGWLRVVLQNAGGDVEYMDYKEDELVLVPDELPTAVGSVVGLEMGGYLEFTLRRKDSWTQLNSNTSVAFSDKWFEDKDWDIVWDRGAQNG